MGWLNDQLDLIILNAQQHGFSGFFVYSPQPGHGNLVGSWAAVSGVDPYGNAYPAGLSVLGSSVIITGSGQGVFVYSGTPTLGNLIVSMASAAGTDAFGNNFPQGFGVSAGAIPGTLINPGTIGATQIGSGAVTNPKLAVAAIQALNLNVGASKNLVIDPQFTSALLNPARIGDPDTVGTWTIAANAASDTTDGSGDRLALTLSSGVSLFVVPGEQYFCSVNAAMSVGGFACIGGIEFLFDTGATATMTGTFSGTGITTLTGTVTIPAGVKSAQLFILTSNGASSGHPIYSSPLIYLTNGTNEIQAGAIVTNSLAANAVTAGKIAANTITAAQLSAGIIYAGIVDGTLIQGAELRIKNSHGATIFTVNISAGTWLLYADTGSATQGALTASAAGASGTDEFGNTFLAGLATYITVAAGLGAGRYAIDLGDQALPYTNVASLTFKNLTHVPSLPPAVSAATDTTHGNSLSLDTGRFGAGANDAVLTLQDSTVTGTPSGLVSADTFTVEPVVNAAAALELLGYLELIDQASAPAAVSGAPVIFADANGFPRFLADSASGDTTDYHVGQFTGYLTPSDQTISSTTFATITGLSAVVGAGTYRVKALISWTQLTAAVSQSFRVGFTGTISQVRMTARHVQRNLGTSNSVQAEDTTSNNGNLPSPAYTVANGTAIVEIDGIIVTTSSGTLSIQAAEGTNGDTFSIQALSFFHLEPVN